MTDDVMVRGIRTAIMGASRELGNRRDSRHLEHYEKDRRCPECGTKLSMYNPGPECFVHTPFKQPRIRGRVYEGRKA